MPESNYGATITFGGNPIGKCQVTGWPSIATEKVDATHHGSGGYAEFIPNGLITLGEFSISLILEDGVLDSIHDFMAAQTIDEVVIVDGIDTFTFDGFFLSAEKGEADATAPDVNKADVVIAATGAITITTTS